NTGRDGGTFIRAGESSLSSRVGTLRTSRWASHRTTLPRRHMPPFRTHDEPPKPVEDLRAKSNLGRQKNFISRHGLKPKGRAEHCTQNCTNGHGIGFAQRW
ncbi:unnamed protein product, partial [Ascophyllum nodosum]